MMRRGRRGALGLLLLCGCLPVAQIGTRYSLEREYWRAAKDLSDLELKRSPATPADVERVRQSFLKVVATASRTGGTDPYVRRVTGQCYLKNYDLLLVEGKGAEASGVLRQLLRDFEGDSTVEPEARWRHANAVTASGDSAAAIPDYRAIVRLARPYLLSQGSAAGHVMDIPLSLVRLRIAQSGRASAAEESRLAFEYYYRVAAGMPRSSEAFAARAYVADVLSMLGRPADAIRVLDTLQADCQKVGEQRAKRPELLLRLAAMAGDDAGDLPAAHRYLDMIIRDYPASDLRGRVQLMRGRIFVRQHRNQEALQALKSAADDGSLAETVRAASWVQMGRLADLQNNWDEARRDYVQAYTNFPLTDEGMKAPLAIVQHYVDIKDGPGIRKSWEEARKNYTELLGRYPESTWVQQIRWLLVDSNIALEDWQGAVGTLNQIADLQPKQAAGLRALRMMAQLHELKLNSRKAAIEDYRKVISRFPEASFRPQVEAEIHRLGG